MVQVGNVSGGSQVAIGDYIVQIGRVEGGVVNILNEAPPPPRLRSQPVSLRPRAFHDLLNRETEKASLFQALQARESVECTGEAGSGKTSLLRHLAYQPQLSIFTSGVTYFRVNQQSANDLLQSLFDSFYTCDFPIKPTETEIRHYLDQVNALVLLDQVDVTADQIESLLNYAPNCTFIAATRKRSLFSDTVEVPLKGLPIAEAVRLFQKELARALSPEEQKSAQSICESLNCLPSLVMRAAHEARHENRTLTNVVSEQVASGEIKPRSDDEKKVLAALAVFKGTLVAAEHVAAIAGVTAVEQLLRDLEQRGVVQSHEQRYALAGDVNITQPGDLNSWSKRALAHFVDWTAQHRANPKLIATSAEAILLILRWAVAAQAWPEVKRLGHATEEALTLSGKWDMWAVVLKSIKAAARAQDDDAESAWALHQMGTRALGLGDRPAAEAALKDALSIRERLGDDSGAAVTRHNLKILLAPPPPPEPEPEPEDVSDKGGGVAPTSTPLSIKLGLGLLGLGLIAALMVWFFRSSKPPVNPPKVLAFTVNPTLIPANGQAQLCYEVENSNSVSIEPNIGERKPATKECLSVTANQTVTYTLTAHAADGATTTQQITLNVEPAPPAAEIVHFEVERQNSPDDTNAVQFRLCYEVRNAAHAEIDNDGGAVVLDKRHCQQITPQQTTTYTLTATGSDGRIVTRQATADATKPPALRAQIVSFEALPETMKTEKTAELCFQLKDASTAQIDPGARSITVGSDRQCISVAPAQTTTYTLRAFNSEGKEDNKTATITVSRPPEIVSFTADPTDVLPGASIKLCYQVNNARRLQIDNGVGAVRPVDQGCVQRNIGRDLPVNETYRLTATGSDGQTSSKELKIKVSLPVTEIAEFTANPQTIKRGDEVSLCYRVENAGKTGIEPGVGEVAARNGQRVCVTNQPGATTTYTLTAFNAFGGTPQTRQATVVVVHQPKPANIISFDISSSRIKRGESVRLCYGVADATNITIAPFRKDFPNSEKNCFEDTPRRSTTYVLRATGEDGKTQNREVSVTLEEPVSPQVRITRFEINPTMVHGTQLCYALENARSARIEPGFGELNNLTADCPRLRSLKAETYTLTATGEDGTVDRKVVRYTPPEPQEFPIRITSFSPRAQTIRPGTEARICYSTFGEGTASISPQPGNVPPSLLKRCVTVSPRETTVYTLTVVGPQGEKGSQKVTVNVDKPVILR
jgi:hypothetical protein